MTRKLSCHLINMLAEVPDSRNNNPAKNGITLTFALKCDKIPDKIKRYCHIKETPNFGVVG